MNVVPSGTNLTTGLVGHWTFDGKNMTSNVAYTIGQGKSQQSDWEGSTSVGIDVSRAHG
jgi:hypothetical protein